MEQHEKIHHSAPGAGATVDVLGARVEIKSSGDSRHFFVADHPIPPGYAVPMHLHDAEDEAFYVIAGEIVFACADGEILGGPGTYLMMPRGTAHGFANRSGAPARMLVFASAGGGLEQLFRELDAAAGGGAPTQTQLGDICARNGVHMLPAP